MQVGLDKLSKRISKNLASEDTLGPCSVAFVVVVVVVVAVY